MFSFKQITVILSVVLIAYICNIYLSNGNQKTIAPKENNNERLSNVLQAMLKVT